MDGDHRDRGDPDHGQLCGREADEGLGLALVRQLTRRRGGSIAVTRRVGAVFTVVLRVEGGLAHDEPAATGPLDDVAAGTAR